MTEQTKKRVTDIIIQNLKTISIMKSSGIVDVEIAKAFGLKVQEMLEVIAGDDYIKGVIEKAQEKVVSEIESEFLQNVFQQLKVGETGDAKWVLERLSGKWNKKEKVELGIKSIDEIIMEKKDGN